MRTDRIKTLLAELVTECKLWDEAAAKEREYIAKLESRESDHEADGELLELLVGWWDSLHAPENRPAVVARIRTLIEERKAADGLAHDTDRD